MHDPFAPTRRAFLNQLGVGALGLSGFLNSATAAPHFTPRAKRLIFLFMAGGPSHLDMLDPKPGLEKHAGKRPGSADLRTERITGGLLPSPFRFRPGGKSGLPVSDLLPNLRECADDLCVLRSVYVTNPNHSPAANFLGSGRIDAVHPGIGAWVSYGLGSVNANLPGFVALGNGFGDFGFTRNGYLPGQHQATKVSTRDTDALSGGEWQRVRNFLRHFVEAPNQRLHAAQVAAAAREEGYDPRGTGGFYTGQKPALRSEGPYRVLTAAGHDLYQQAVEWTEE